MGTEERIEALRRRIAGLREEYDQLEAAWPPHGIKPEHVRRLEELEDLITEKERELADLIG